MAAPTTEAELAETIRMATGPLCIRGGGTRLTGIAGQPLLTGGLCGIRLYEPGALTLVVGAGTPLADVEAVLASERQRLAFEPMDHRPALGTTGAPTIGGVVAMNVSGPRRVQVGAARDFVLGVRFVDGTGTVVKNGGRVMKNVTGYDLARLMAGARGTLGVLSEVALKVLPETEHSASLILRGLSPAAAVAAMSRALGSPFEVSGAAHLGRGADAMTCLRIEGFEASVTYRLGQLVALLSDGATIEAEVDGDRVAALWRGIRDIAALAQAPGDLWRLSVRPGDAPVLLDRLPEGSESQLDWGGGLIWVRTARGTDLRAHIAPFAGHATLMRAEPATFGRIARLQPEPPGVAALAAALRDRFDPRGILNRGIAA